jgi:Dna[CI] antecedent DciA-like protein
LIEISAVSEFPVFNQQSSINNCLFAAMLESCFPEFAVTEWKEEESDLEHAAAGVEKLVTQSLRKSPPAEAPLLAWPFVCGSAVAERTLALNFADGVLRVEVADAGWKSELQALAPRYLATINRYSPEAVRRIEFVVASPKGAGGSR